MLFDSFQDLKTQTSVTSRPGSELAILLASQIQAHNGPLLVVTENAQTAQQLAEECRYFTQNRVYCETFNDWETLPYDHFSPHEDIISDRLTLLNKLSDMQRGAVFVAASTLAHCVCPVEYVKQHSFILHTDQKMDHEAFVREVVQQGYRRVSEVMEHGEFTVRGSIIDIFPMGNTTPYRLDLFDDTLDTIRPFDPETQRSFTPIEGISILPAHEFPMTEAGIETFRVNWRSNFPGNPTLCDVYDAVSDGIVPAGIEYYLPLFFEKTASLLDYLPSNTRIIKVGHIADKIDEFMSACETRYEQYKGDINRPILKPSQLFLNSSDLGQKLNHFDCLGIKLDEKYQAPSIVPLPSLQIDAKAKQPLHHLASYLEKTQAQKIVLCAQTKGRRETLSELLRDLKVAWKLPDNLHEILESHDRFFLTVASLHNGFEMPLEGIVFISENDLFGEAAITRRSKRQKATQSEHFIRNLIELKIGDEVVHEDHGIGRYLGLKMLETGGIAGEYLVLEYANNDKIYLPVGNIDLISRYSGVDNEHATLSRLGSKHWSQVKKKAIEQIQDTAAELLNLYARRKAKPGLSHRGADTHYLAFAQGFPFEETPDQERAIEEVIKDMASPNPMDRLVCGDVGFGKTEVAMRAAFIAVNSGKQVAVLVPTTLLCQQHLESFKDRFADHAVNIRQLSRFCTEKERTQTLKDISSGKADIVIGTHALLSNLIDFKDLGLIIIDEEHRFGVKQKEKLKALRAEVDILTLTATPIPRTLNMAMQGVRDLSIIATPPKRRLSIKTFVREKNAPLIKEAILREILRGGQVYYLHNKVETIEKEAREIAAMVPQARVHVAHGQMHERELEKVMADFYHHRFNVLVCTTIIETGIDLPTANTIIMDRADKLGMAQLHQLRGRVGRSHHQAYAYLFTPPPKQLTADARKRLEVISSLEDLGAGFMLATHDLEIRGAGEILGQQQSGHIQAIGFHLYTELLEKAVESLKEGREPDLTAPVHQHMDMDLKLPALIPDDYLNDVHTRLIFYKRLASAKQISELHEIQVEMIDRFGLLPQAVKNLFKVTELRLKAKAMGVKKIDAGPSGGVIEFTDSPNINPKTIIDLIQNKPKIYKLRGQSRLQFESDLGDSQQRILFIHELLETLKLESLPKD